MTLVARHGALTDIGLHRKTNEDTFVVRTPLFAVCDGMGGAQAGEVASGLAAETLAAGVAAGRPLLEVAEAANAAVFARAKENAEQTGMGTTLTAFVLEGATAHFVHIGDSRAYLLRDGLLEQVSDDHSLVGEMVRDGRLSEADAAVHPHRSILSRALGTEAVVDIDEFAVDLRAGDVLLLCSDGLSGPVAADDMRAALSRDDPEAAAQKLIREARKHGGPDNITAVVVRFDEAPSAGSDDEVTAVMAADDELTAVTAELRPLEQEITAVTAGLPPLEDDVTAVTDDLSVPVDEPASIEAPTQGAAEETPSAAAAQAAPPAGVASATRRKRSPLGLGIVAGVLAVLTTAGIVAAVVLSTVFFIGVDDGRLAVYSGLPREIGPVNLHAVYRRSVRTYDSLSAEERRIVDAQMLRGRSDVLDVSERLEMWP